MKFKFWINSSQIINQLYNILKEDSKGMGSINILGLIGMALFWIKFHIFILLKYAYNFLKHHLQKLLNGNSKTTICPYKNTHEHVFLQLEDLIHHDGYSIDEYEFETPDQAYVSFWRVRAKDPAVLAKPFPVLLLHGLLDCSVSWFLHQDKAKCLPYILASQGYDVWVGNNRGTKHSQKNSHLPNYWSYNFDSFVEYDQPTMINSILKQTQKQKLIYIGHSQGSTQFLVSTGIHDFDQKIVCFVGMGTVISLENVRDHVVLRYLSRFRGVQVLRLLGFKTVLNLPKWVTRATGILIYNTDFYFKFFFGIVNTLCGKPTKNKIDTDRLGVIISHEPGGTSIPNVQQWIQFYNTGKIKKFDYGPKKNLAKYGCREAPEYSFEHLRRLGFNSYVFKGEVDAVISDRDYGKLEAFMDGRLKTFQLKDYAHLDYVWGKEAHEDIYHKIVKILQQEQQSY